MPTKVDRTTNGTGTTSVSSLATIYGCCGLFDLCSDNDLMSLSFEGTNPFLDWLGWELTDVCNIKKNFITYVRAEATEAGTASAGTTTACAESNGVEWGWCDFSLEDFGLLRRHSPIRDVTKVNLRLCEAQPRYRLDGTPITNDLEYDMRLVTEVLIQDLKRMIVSGSKLTPGQFDGLERLVKTGYTNSAGGYCRTMDSIILNWNSNTLSGGNGITWNGKAVGNTYDFVDVLLAAFRRIRDRIRMAPVLSAQAMNVGDIVFVAPSALLRCLLDLYTCWSVCPGAEFNEVNLNTYEARNFRDKLNGGMFGAGRIYLDGFEIPLMPYEWGLVKSHNTFDAYLLTGSVGSVKAINGQMLDMRSVPSTYPELTYGYTDGGRLLTWAEHTKTCAFREVEMQPRLLMWAPWAQVRFQDVSCDVLGGVLSPDPWAVGASSSFFPETSFNGAVCPDGAAGLVLPS